MREQCVRRIVSIYSRLLDRRLRHVPDAQKAEVARSFEDHFDIMPRPVLLAMAIVTALLAGLGWSEASQAWSSANWLKAAITGAGALFLAVCAVGWLRRWRKRGSGDRDPASGAG